MDYVYLWADGIHVNIRLEEHKLCLLVMIGVRADGRKELVALAGTGTRESAESWADLLRDCARRGMRAPVLAAGDGALRVLGCAARGVPAGQGAALLVPQVRQRSRRAPEVRAPGREEALAEIWGAEDKQHALAAARSFDAAYGAKFPKAAAKITDDLDQLLTFYDYPADHWVHLRTTNPIESTFATVRHRTKVTKGPGYPRRRLAMAFKLIESAQVPLARRQRAPPRGPGPRRRHLHQRKAHRAARSESRAGSRLNDHDPQVLTIARRFAVCVACMQCGVASAQRRSKYAPSSEPARIPSV